MSKTANRQWGAFETTLIGLVLHVRILKVDFLGFF
jgi:hypothetical protein